MKPTSLKINSALVLGCLAMGCQSAPKEPASPAATTAAATTAAASGELAPFTPETGVFMRWLIAQMGTRKIKGAYTERDGEAAAEFVFGDREEADVRCRIVVRSGSVAEDGKEIMVHVRAYTAWYIAPSEWAAALPVLNQYHYETTLTKAFVDVKDYELTLQASVNMVGRPAHIDTLEDAILRTVTACKYLVGEVKKAKVGVFKP